MHLPSTDEVVLICGAPPIRAQKARYFEDRQLNARVVSPPMLIGNGPAWSEPAGSDDRTGRSSIVSPVPSSVKTCDDEDTDGGVRREPELPEHEEIAPDPVPAHEEFADLDDEPDDEAQRARAMQKSQFRTVSRQVALDPDDVIGP